MTRPRPLYPYVNMLLLEDPKKAPFYVVRIPRVKVMRYPLAVHGAALYDLAGAMARGIRFVSEMLGRPTLCFSGSSGSAIASVLWGMLRDLAPGLLQVARGERCHRKEIERSHKTSLPGIDSPGFTCFVDDLVASGATMQRVHSALGGALDVVCAPGSRAWQLRHAPFGPRRALITGERKTPVFA